jgi:hypothetical protein
MVRNNGKVSSPVAEQLELLKAGGAPIIAPLRTSALVFRRVTDGIYREPWAALRELISNAYDADASRVEVLTDPPWFRQITVRDNGNGFTQEALLHTLQSIGASSKREGEGQSLGVTSPSDPSKSPGGRRLIGKLGIGLFAIANLAPRFRIVTKARGERVRSIADVSLFKHRETGPDGVPLPDDVLLHAGEFSVRSFRADDPDAHGTDIIVDDVYPATRAEFQTSHLWKLRMPLEDGDPPREPPPFHIGYPGAEPGTYEVPPVVPWEVGDKPEVRFTKLTEAMFDRVDAPGAGRKPSLATTFDNYFRFVWMLSLGAPLDYIQAHPFDLDADSGVRFFRLGPLKGQATEITLPKGKTLREHLKLKAPERGRARGFSVYVDEMQLRRPVRTEGLKGSGSVPVPLLFVGADKPDLSQYDVTRAGGPLEFEGYLLWSHRVVPFDHAGALVRVGDSSGSLFDQTFMGYPVSEQKRKEQVTSEIYALQGLDAALNIDRESFNRSHPHFQYVARWLHDAFRQFANRHKEIGRDTATKLRARRAAATNRQLVDITRDIVADRTDGDEPISVEFSDEPSLFSKRKSLIVVSSSKVLAALPSSQRVTEGTSLQFAHRSNTLRSVLQVLYAAGLLDGLTAAEIESIATDLAKVVFSGESS